VPRAAIEAARGVEVLVIDALRHEPHPTHLSVKGAIEAARAMGAKHAYFTHICHDLGHAATEAELPDGIHMAYDGLRLPIA
jgi:phosphoribosyl 1,2-cyclic phosphate phosphodiesterase